MCGLQDFLNQDLLRKQSAKQQSNYLTISQITFHGSLTLIYTFIPLIAYVVIYCKSNREIIFIIRRMENVKKYR